MDLSNFIAPVFITLYHMSFRTISKNTLLSCVILLCITLSCYSQNVKTSDNNQDLLIDCDGKMLQRLNICFYRKEGEVFFAQKLFLLVSSPKKTGIYLYETDKFSPKIIPADQKVLRNIFTAEEFRRRYDSDETMKRIFNQIDPLFLELSNVEKMNVLENYMEGHNKGYQKEEPD